MSRRVNSAQIAIIGAGLAGAATAFWLTQRGVRDVLLLEQEAAPGVHASGRNAAMVRQVVPDPEVASMARQGAAFIRQVAEAQPRRTLFSQTGSLLLGCGPEWASLRHDAEVAQQAGLAVECLGVSAVIRRVPVLTDAEFEGALWCPSDGVVEVAWLLDWFLEEAQRQGARLKTECPVTGLEIQSERIVGVRTAEGAIGCSLVVNATGAWAGEVGRLAGAAPITLTPYRRHLYVTEPLAWVDRSWPFVWDLTHDLYFRPESGGLLLCPCDEVPWPPGIPPVDPTVTDHVAERLPRYFPALKEVSIRQSWAGLPTFASDRRSVIGWDPLRDGFFWVAGLGGHGVTVSGAVGALAADLIVTGCKMSGGPFDPARFVTP
jgi:glycine/D-amino acid oxidase-like deaminating enzyme